MTTSSEILAAAHRRYLRFEDQFLAVSKALEQKAKEFSIALIAVYGSVMTGVRPGSDVDMLVLLSEEFKARGENLLDLKDVIEDYAKAACVNEIPLDLHIVVARSFVDTSHGTEFKRSFSENNMILWEDGVTIDRRFISRTEGV